VLQQRRVGGDDRQPRPAVRLSPNATIRGRCGTATGADAGSGRTTARRLVSILGTGRPQASADSASAAANQIFILSMYDAGSSRADSSPCRSIEGLGENFSPYVVSGSAGPVHWTLTTVRLPAGRSSAHNDGAEVGRRHYDWASWCFSAAMACVSIRVCAGRRATSRSARARASAS